MDPFFSKQDQLFFNGDGGSPALHDHIFHKVTVFRAGIFMIFHAVHRFDQRQAETDPGAMAAAATQIIIDLNHKRNLLAGHEPQFNLIPIIAAEPKQSQE